MKTIIYYRINQNTNYVSRDLSQWENYIPPQLGKGDIIWRMEVKEINGKLFKEDPYIYYIEGNPAYADKKELIRLAREIVQTQQVPSLKSEPQVIRRSYLLTDNLYGFMSFDDKLFNLRPKPTKDKPYLFEIKELLYDDGRIERSERELVESYTEDKKLEKNKILIENDNIIYSDVTINSISLDTPQQIKISQLFAPSDLVEFSCYSSETKGIVDQDDISGTFTTETSLLEFNKIEDIEINLLKAKPMDIVFKHHQANIGDFVLRGVVFHSIKGCYEDGRIINFEYNYIAKEAEVFNPYDYGFTQPNTNKLTIENIETSKWEWSK